MRIASFRRASSLIPFMIRFSFFLLLVLAAFLECSCENASAVGQFASASAQALGQGPPILSDLAASCVREKTDTDPREGLAPPNKASIDMECKQYADQIPGLLSDSVALTNYFTAISQLASAGSTTAGTNPGGQGQANGSGAAAAGGARGGASRGGASPPASPAVQDLGVAGDIFKFLGQLATDGFRSRHLDKDVKDQHDHVDNVIQALINAVQSNYYTRLENEQTGIENFYSTLARGADGATIVLIRNRRDHHLDLIEANRQKAMNYVQALMQIKSGNDQLKSAASLKAKNMPALLQPYTAQLAQLIPTLLQ